MRFGLFGTGPWAHMAHAPALLAHEDVDLVGVWGRDPAKAAAFGVRAYADQDELIADVDAVAIALPPDVQAPIALKAARAGKHLLLDKPVAFTTEEAGEIAAVAEERNLASVVFFTRRLFPGVQAFMAEAASTGGWLEGRIDHLGSIFGEGNPFGESPWRKTSGGLWDVGPHAFAHLLPVLGPVTEVSAMTGARDMTHLLARHAGGAISTLTLSVDSPAAAAREDYWFAGEAGIRQVPKDDMSAVDALKRAVDQLLTAAGGGARSELDVRFGAEVTAILVAAQEAVESGRAVPVTRSAR